MPLRLVRAFLFIFILLQGPLRAAENCGRLLSDGGFIFASWAALPLSSESELGTFWETYLKKLCLQTECPLFCSEENGKAPANLLALQKKCREKETDSCNAFFEAIKIKERGPTEFCFYVGGKACDLCDRLGGEYCQPGMRFGGLKQKYDSLINHKIACRAGFQEACDLINQKFKEGQERLRQRCEEGDQTACESFVNSLIDYGKLNEALDKALGTCKKSQYKTCKSFLPRPHKDFPSINADKFSQLFQQAIETECDKNKTAASCSVYASFIEYSKPTKALELYQLVCRASPQKDIPEDFHYACSRVFSDYLKNKKWKEAKGLLKVVCQGLKEAQLRNRVNSPECGYEKDLKEAQRKLGS